MSSRSRISKRKLATSAVILFLIPLILFLAWVSIPLRMGEMSDRDHIDTFLSYFPSVIQNNTVIFLFSALCCLVALILASKSAQKKLMTLRIMMMVVIVGSIFLLFFSISRLM